MAEKIKLVQGDTGPQLRVTLTEETSGEAIDLTGGTATLHFRALGSTTTLFSRAGYINPATATLGEVIFTWGVGDLNVPPGEYEGEIEVVLASGMRQSVYELLKFKVREDLA